MGPNWYSICYHTGTILVDSAPEAHGGGAALYARVSSWDQQADLDRQLGRLMRLLADPTISPIVVEHRDRLARFGVEYLDAALRAQGRRVVVTDPGETTSDLGRDMVDVLTAFCARLYGRRSARNRARRAVTAAKSGLAQKQAKTRPRRSR